MTIRRRFAAAAVTVLTAGLAAGTATILPGAANAATCAAGAPCDSVGSLDLGGGVLTMTTPATLTWTASVIGAPQTVYDAIPADGTFQVSDLRGILTGVTAGWDVTATATTFTGTTSATHTIPDPGATGTVLSFGGGSTTLAAAVAPTSACTTTGDCTVPTQTLPAVYPAFVLTGAAVTPVTIYNATAGTGTGAVQVGSGANLATWALTLPAILAADTYTSTITISVSAGP